MSGTFTIANHGKSDLMLRRIYTIDPGVTVYAPSDKVKKGKTTEVTITVVAVRSIFSGLSFPTFIKTESVRIP